MEKIFSYKGGEIFYEVSGQGSTVVLLHGFGEDRTIWQQQVAFLQGHCQLIVPDLPGTGQSTLLQSKQVSIADFSEAIYALIQHELLGRPIVLGHSMGGYITLALVEKHPEIVHAFGLIHSTAFADTEEKKNMRRKAIEMIGQYDSYSFLKNTIPNLFSDNFRKNNSNTVNALIESGKSFSSSSLIQYYTAMMNRPDRTHVLRNTTVPVLFVIGEDDVAAPLSDLESQVELPNKSNIHILEKVGHMSMLESSDDLNHFMLHFINDNMH